MAGLYDDPGAHVMDRVGAVEKVLQYLAASQDALEWVERKSPGMMPLSADAFEGLAELLRACAKTLEETRTN